MPRDPGRLRHAGLTLRGARADDLPFLRALYATTRAEDVGALPWPEAAKAAFLAQQFEAQHRAFVGGGLASEYWLVEQAARPIGRLYLATEHPTWRVIDIALLPDMRGRGHGTALLDWVQATARAAGAAGVDLHVLATNSAAERLYRRLGFVPGFAPAGPHRRMLWRVS